MEFKEVCKQWRRMCDSFKESAASEYRPCAEKCPVGCNPVCGELDAATPQDIERFEAAVTRWAAENPVKVYPTWWEWLQAMGLIRIQWNGPVLASMRLGVDDIDYISVKKKMLEHIPADIAQRLGLQPKEG